MGSLEHRRAFDAHMMAIALTEARRGLGQTAPNPSVGAVIANEATGEVIARAVTKAGGRPHAETVAIAAAGDRAKGMTMYVTLEPCAHHGKTPPCAEAVVASGVKRVVVGIEDPDPRVAGRGLQILRDAGIEVERGVRANDVRWVTRGHIVRITERRPFVTIKMATAADGSVPRGNGGSPAFVTGEMARAHGHWLRAHHDAILVGEGTARDDDPLLTCRLAGLERRSPVRVLLSRQLNVRLDSRLIRSARETPFWIYCGDDARPDLRKECEELGTVVMPVTAVGGRLWLPAIMESLVAHGITRLLVEGGPSIWKSFAAAALCDEVALYTPADSENMAKKVIEDRLGPLNLTLADERTLGSDKLWRYRRTLPEAKR